MVIFLSHGIQAVTMRFVRLLPWQGLPKIVSASTMKRYVTLASHDEVQLGSRQAQRPHSPREFHHYSCCCSSIVFLRGPRTSLLSKAWTRGR